LARAGRGLSVVAPSLGVVSNQAGIVAQRVDAPLAVLFDKSVLVDALCPLRADARLAVQAELVDARLRALPVGSHAHIGLEQDVIVYFVRRRRSFTELI